MKSLRKLLQGFIDTLLVLNKLIRPIIPVTGGLTAWIISRACGANNRTAAAAAVAIALSSIGASFWHYSEANPMYARKEERLKFKNPVVKFKNPKVLMFTGLMIFCLSIVIAHQWLPQQCIYLYLFNTVTIAAYSIWLSSSWTTKNVTMAVISITPVITGWQAGQFTHPLVRWAITIAALAHFAHEVVKDVMDIKANEGIRVTLPMVITPERALQLVGILLVIAGIASTFLLQFVENTMQQSLVMASVGIFLLTAILLLVLRRPGVSKTAITAGLCFAILALLRL